MHDVYSAAGVRIFDDVLPDAQFEGLSSWAERVTYQGVHHERWRPVWRLGQGEPLRGPTWSTLKNRPGCPPALEPLAAILRTLLLQGPNESARVSLTPWIYPCGTALGMHRDDGDFDGSFIFYTVPEWDVHWGGLLHCVADESERGPLAPPILDMTAERASVSTIGRGMWIAPVRNRLVTLAAQVSHFISRVDTSAGDRSRLSIAGFVHRNG